MKEYTDHDLNSGKTLESIKNLLNNIKSTLNFKLLKIGKQEEKTFSDLNLILLRRLLNRSCIFCNSNNDLSFDLNTLICICSVCNEEVKK